MEKRLEDRSLEELWQLFPIFLVPHKKEWAEYHDDITKRKREEIQ